MPWFRSKVEFAEHQLQIHIKMKGPYITAESHGTVQAFEKYCGN
jgi:hypothetical protein